MPAKSVTSIDFMSRHNEQVKMSRTPKNRIIRKIHITINDAVMFIQNRLWSIITTQSENILKE